MGARTPADGGDHLGRVLGREAEHCGSERHLDVAGERSLAVPHRPGDHGGHADLTLEGRRARVVGPPDLDAGNEALRRAQHDAVLTERRQDLLDVAEEHPVGPDDEQTLALEGKAVGVEQVGGAVEGDRRLPRTGSALDHDHPGQRSSDDLVLLPLDRGHDVAHVAGA